MAFVASLPLFGGNAVQRTSRSTCRVRMELDEANKPLRRPPQPTAKPESGATWADEFLAPFPRKGVGSVVDYDLRPQSLQEGQVRHRRAPLPEDPRDIFECENREPT